MNIDDLIKALQGANITINLQGGTGNTFFAGRAQINQQQYNATEQDRDRPFCNICGRSGGADLESHLVGNVHTHCRKQAANEARHRKFQRESYWQVIESKPNHVEVEAPAPEPEAQPRQLPAPTPRNYLEELLTEISERYAASYAELRANGARFGMAQADEMRDWTLRRRG